MAESNFSLNKNGDTNCSVWQVAKTPISNIEMGNEKNVWKRKKEGQKQRTVEIFWWSHFWWSRLSPSLLRQWDWLQSLMEKFARPVTVQRFWFEFIQNHWNYPICNFDAIDWSDGNWSTNRYIIAEHFQPARHRVSIGDDVGWTSEWNGIGGRGGNFKKEIQFTADTTFDHLLVFASQTSHMVRDHLANIACARIKMSFMIGTE